MSAYTLDDYYNEYINNHYNPDDDNDDSLHTYCNDKSSQLGRADCLIIIDEMFDNQLEAIQSYMIEYDEMPVYRYNMIKTHRILAFHAIMEYIRDRMMDNDDNDNDDNDNDD